MKPELREPTTTRIQNHVGEPLKMGLHDHTTLSYNVALKRGLKNGLFLYGCYLQCVLADVQRQVISELVSGPLPEADLTTAAM